MNPETINSVIDHLAEKLAIPAGKLLEILPRIGYKNMVIVIMLIALLALGWLLAVLGIYLTEHYDSDYVYFTIIGIVIALFCLIFLPGFLPDFLLWRHDPQAWALQYILNMVH